MVIIVYYDKSNDTNYIKYFNNIDCFFCRFGNLQHCNQSKGAKILVDSTSFFDNSLFDSVLRIFSF